VVATDVVSVAPSAEPDVPHPAATSANAALSTATHRIGRPPRPAPDRRTPPSATGRCPKIRSTSMGAPFAIHGLLTLRDRGDRVGAADASWSVAALTVAEGRRRASGPLPQNLRGARRLDDRRRIHLDGDLVEL